MRRAAIKQKRELVLFYFYFSFIAVVPAALSEEIQIEERNHATFSMWYGACVHMGNPSFLVLSMLTVKLFV